MILVTCSVKMATSINILRNSRSINFLNAIPRISYSYSRLLATDTTSPVPSVTCPSAGSTTSQVGNAGAAKAQKINKAMIAYLERAEAHNAFMKSEIAEFEIGKRHLANIMGKNPEEFNQEDIDEAIEYLLPSGLFDKKARPKLKHPEEALPKRKAAEFGLDGRPFHCFFYTGKPNYVDAMHNLALKLEELKVKDVHQKVPLDKQPDKIQLVGSEWLDKKTLELKFQEPLSDSEYEGLINMLEFLCTQRWATDLNDLIFSYRNIQRLTSKQQQLPPLQQDEKGRTYQEAEGLLTLSILESGIFLDSIKTFSSRRHTRAVVRLYGEGTGRCVINGLELLEYFPDIYHRKEIMFPLHLVDKLGRVDVEAEVGSGGATGQAGAVRHGISLALQSFVTEQQCEQLRLAGLLTRDPRVAERKKPGQQGARRKYTWKKR